MENYLKSTGSWLITIDLDGTFLKTPSEKHNAHEANVDYHEKNLEVVKKLIEQGHKVAIVTGRPWKDSKEVYESMGLESIIANYNGSHIHFPGHEDEFATLTYSINKEILDKVLKQPVLANATKAVVMETLNTTYSTNIDTDLSKRITHERETKVKEWQVGEPYEGAPLSALVEIDLDKIEDHNDIIQVLKRKFGAAFFFRFWDNSHGEKPWLMLEINQKTSNKGSAMKHIAEFYNIPLSRTMSFGDGLNDREMLIDAAVGVAMKNARGTVKTYADDTTNLTNDEAGVGDYLEEFFNLK